MGKIHVAVVTGHHNFDVPGFQKLLDSMPQATFYLQDLHNFVSDEGKFNETYKAVIFYNFHQESPVTSQAQDARLVQAIDKLAQNGQGLLILHHALLAFPDWTVWNQIVGISNRKFRYATNQTVETEVVAKNHPITDGLQRWEMIDEIYGMIDARDDSQFILSTRHPDSMKYLAWTREYKNSRVFCYQSGHDNLAFSNPSFRQVISQAINWLIE
mgnify:FL=1|tara:strand:- start:421 stop:1062 length:642 start_codon:yes stop_codon:yes gene_type:complete